MAFTSPGSEAAEILSIKEKIAQDQGWDTSQQKLIYSGKILQDQNTVESYNIEEKGFIVCMVSKVIVHILRQPKATSQSSSSTPAKAPSTPAPPPIQTPSAPAAPVPASRPTAANVPDTPSPAGAATASGTNFSDPSALAMGAQREAAISNMESMGFPRADIDRAMRAAYFNPDRAVEYLLTGIPENLQQEQRQANQAQPGASAPAAASSPPAAGHEAANPSGEDQPINLFEAAAQAGRSGGGSGGARSGGGASAAAGAAGGLGNLDFLRNNPQFQQLRQVVQQQPQMLEPILQQVGAGNPQLAQLIGQNPDQFLQLLSEDPHDDEDNPLPPGAQAISVTEDEREAIERLCRLGFERDLVIQAYFACDKNEELAANFLFEQPDEPDEN
ncbi:hypothetical protein FGG08_006898 [Glutinoglossum americanum]|uniref:UV excision repair protein RAD23 n=1 Tax=Glutinoglossum americanum TaxID=1670608 RepID=A0A9P8I0K5_9PEZI|nr:hypothetical protein FGG08_006898 [Glutinoglossum americanum]